MSRHYAAKLNRIHANPEMQFGGGRRTVRDVSPENVRRIVAPLKPREGRNMPAQRQSAVGLAV